VTRSLSTPADQVIRRVRADTSTLRPVPRPALATLRWSCPGAGATPGNPPGHQLPSGPAGPVPGYGGTDHRRRRDDCGV